MSTITSQRTPRLRIVTMFMTYIPSSSTVVAFLVATTMRLCDRMLQQQQQQQRLRAMKLEKRKPLQNGSVRTRTLLSNYSRTPAVLPSFLTL